MYFMYFFITKEGYYAIYRTYLRPVGTDLLHLAPSMWTMVVWMCLNATTPACMHGKTQLYTARQGVDGWVWTKSLSGKVVSKKKKKNGEDLRFKTEFPSVKKSKFLTEGRIWESNRATWLGCFNPLKCYSGLFFKRVKQELIDGWMI